MAAWAFDIETVINCFTVTFVNVDDERDVKAFVISGLEEFRLAPSRHKISSAFELLNFMHSLKPDDLLIGYNSLNFDMPILSEVYHLALNYEKNIEKRAYTLAQSIVTEESKVAVNVTWACRQVPHLDLFKLHHFDNEAKRTSLKWIQCHLNMENIEEMPHEHYIPVTRMDEIHQILSYNLNDVIATVRLYKHQKTKDLIELRKWAIEKYSLTTGYNTSNAHMGETVFISQLGSIRPPDKSPGDIHVYNFLVPMLFESKVFQTVYSEFRSLILQPGERFSKKVAFDGMMYHFGLGGIHAAREDKIFNNVQSVDVKSFYPNIAIQFGFKPKHVGEKFTTIYKNLYDERIKTKNKVHNAGLKESLNSVFGKSNSEFSPLYDPSFTYSITINGQLLIVLLCEEITLKEAGQIIMANTDGIEVRVYNQELFNQIIKSWSDKFGMPLSLDRYQKLIIRDVNNYIGIYNEGTFKTKGAYEISKDFHKDPSAKICAIAAVHYYMGNSTIESAIDSLADTGNYEPFFMYRRAKTGYFSGVSSDGRIDTVLPKTIRYLVTKKGMVLYHTTDSMKSKIHSDAYVSIVNNINDKPEFTIDKSWYIKEAKKLLINTTPTLFA